MNTRDGIEIFPYSFFKTGRKGSFVDNAGAGGVYCSVDDSTGKLRTDGIDERGRKFKTHPESGIVYKETQLPEWDKALELCKELAYKLPRMKYCSWDLAHTVDGWVVVEGNMAGQMVCQQSTLGYGLKSEWNKFIKRTDVFI